MSRLIDPKILKKYSKTVTVRTCVGIYDRLRYLRPELYALSPSEGVNITTDYVDTGNPEGRHRKTIVALHGKADTYATFTRLIEHFAQNPDIRLIAPNMPSFRHSIDTNFAYWNSSVENRQWLKDFFERLNVERIDCLVAHSMGCGNCAALLEMPGHLQIKSFGFSSPHFILSRTEGKFVTENRAHFLDLLKDLRIEWSLLKIDNLDLLFGLICYLSDDRGLEMTENRVRNLRQRVKSGGFICYGDSDPIIPIDAVTQTYDYMGINEHLPVETDDPSLVPSSLKSNDEIASFIMKKAGHFPHSKFSKFTARAIEILIEK